MQTKTIGRGLFGALIGAGLIAAAGVAAADENDRSYDVTITNVTRGQVVTPPIVIVHGAGYVLFESGAAASAELVTLAETGNPGPLAASAGADPAVADVATGGGVLLPGESVTLTVTAGGGAKYLSAAAMLAVTNDGFAALRGIKLPKKGSITVGADIYDAGSEANNEANGFVPALGGGNARDTADAEGFVHVHAGVHGGVDLDPAQHDWRNPGVEITIQRVDGDDD